MDILEKMDSMTERSNRSYERQISALEKEVKAMEDLQKAIRLSDKAGISNEGDREFRMDLAYRIDGVNNMIGGYKRGVVI